VCNYSEACVMGRFAVIGVLIVESELVRERKEAFRMRRLREG
jgi:hypothetical protein